MYMGSAHKRDIAKHEMIRQRARRFVKGFFDRTSCLTTMLTHLYIYRSDCTPRHEDTKHGVQRRMISVETFFVFLRLLFSALLLLYVT